MHGWLHIAAVVAAAAAAFAGVLSLLVFLQRRRRSSRKQQNDLGESNGEIKRTESTPKLRGFNRQNYMVFRREVSSKPLFSWADHPSLVTDAVENGWSQFAFTNGQAPSPPSIRSTLLGACAAGDRGREMGVEISWEVCHGSADFMQKIKLNSGSKKISSDRFFAIRAALPLPGPPLASSSFPHEAYFEITILSPEEDDHDPFGNGRKIRKIEGDKIKLIHENPNAKANLKEPKHGRKDDGNAKVGISSIGLTREGSPPLKLPGSYHGSVGFNSDGSVFLDGIKLVLESDEQKWGKPNKVVGCGYNPNQRKVFFTVDSELVHAINCKSEEFSTPLYPTLASNTETSILVNFGQRVFEYAPANLQRTPNPCFIGPLANSPSLGYEDSKELFSMGRIDSQWLNRSTTRTGLSHNTNLSRSKGLDFDVESESDLFEIALDSCGRSPNTVLQRENEVKETQFLQKN
ncbi:hypothetical protein NMG60_11016465 [Bertholletia excelsa]